MSSTVVVWLGGLSGSVVVGGATLLGVWLTDRHRDSAERKERRLQAYAALLVAAGTVLGAYRRLEATLLELDGQSRDEANAHMRKLAAELHEASAVVALTGSEAGRQQGKALYEIAKRLADTRIEPSGDPNYPWHVITKGGDLTLESAIDEYKAAVVHETA